MYVCIDARIDVHVERYLFTRIADIHKHKHKREMGTVS